MIQQIGPNVSISANARIGAGARLISCIVLDDVEIKVEVKTNQKLLCIELKCCVFVTFVLCSISGKRSCSSCNCWVEIFYWEMVSRPGKLKNLLLSIIVEKQSHLYKNE